MLSYGVSSFLFTESTKLSYFVFCSIKTSASLMPAGGNLEIQMQRYIILRDCPQEIETVLQSYGRLQSQNAFPSASSRVVRGFNGFQQSKTQTRFDNIACMFYCLPRNILYFLSISFFPLSREMRSRGTWNISEIQETSKQKKDLRKADEIKGEDGQILTEA